MKILTRYSIDCCNDNNPIEEDSLGAWVKFSDVMEAQNTAHNSRVMPCECDACHSIAEHHYCDSCLPYSY